MKDMEKYKYNKKENKFTENGHTMFEEDVLQRLKRLAHLEALKTTESKTLRDLFDSFYKWLDGLSEAEYDEMSLTDKCEKFFFSQPIPTNPWIKVSERLPEFGQPVIVHCRIYGVFLATYEAIGEFQGVMHGNWRDFNDKFGTLPPTHWQPLPTAPKD